MSIQITLSNPFTRARPPKGASVQTAPTLSLIEPLAPASGTLVEPRRHGELYAQQLEGNDVLAVMAMASSALTLRVLASAHSKRLTLAVYQGRADDQQLLARAELQGLMAKDDADAEGPCSTWDDLRAHPVVAQTLQALRQGNANAGPAGQAQRPKRSLAIKLALGLAGLSAVAALLWVGTALTAPAGPTSTPLVSPAPASADLPQDVLNAQERSVLVSIVAESGIALEPGDKGKPFVVFSDPNCPACRQLEEQMRLIDRDKFMPIVVPVSFKANSREKVASVLCSKDVAQAWKASVASEPDAPAGAQCTKGTTQAEKNNAAFVALRLNSTPTLVAPNGRVIAGSGTAAQITQWLKDNS